MIKILLDPQIFSAQKFGGISRYYVEIYDALKAKEQVQIDCPLLYTENIHFTESKAFRKSFQRKNILLIKNSKIFRSYRPKKLKDKITPHVISKLKKQNFDVFIPTYYDPYFLEYLNNKPFVLTVYDMIHELFPQYFSDDKIIVSNKKLLIERATKIIAISKSTRDDILAVYPHIEPSKIDIVYLAHAIKTNSKIELILPENYILFVGNRSFYKNFFFFLKAVSPVLKKRPDLHVVCAGGNPFDTQEIQLIDELGINERIIQQNFSDAALSAYYENARCFVFPSEYEGFGIPVLEAMACSCPVILANHSSFPEVAGNAGIYFELNNQADLTEKIVYLLENEDLRQDYIEKGLDQAQKFNWESTADACLKVYQKAI